MHEDGKRGNVSPNLFGNLVTEGRYFDGKNVSVSLQIAVFDWPPAQLYC